LNKINSIFFGFLLIFLPLTAAADFHIATGISLRADHSGKDAEFLKDAIRQIDRIGKKSDIKRSAEKIVIICNQGEYFGFFGKGQLYIPGTADRWGSDFELRRRIYGVLASHRYDFQFPADSPGVAPWIACGIDAEITAKESTGQYNSANRGFFLLAEIAGANGSLPDFAAMARLGRPENPLAREIVSEQSRLLLRIFSEKKRIGELVAASCAAGAAPDDFVKFFPSPEKAAKELSKAAMPMLWNRYSPMPPALALKQLSELDRIYLPQYDENGAPTGEYVRGGIKELARYAVRDGKNAAVLKNQLAADYISLGRMLTDREMKICRQLAFHIRQLGSAPEAEKDFETALAGLAAGLRRREDVWKFLHATLDLHAPLPDRFGRLFDAVELHNYSSTAEELNFLRKIINSYSY
jgi:hypothetical protein